MSFGPGTETAKIAKLIEDREIMKQLLSDIRKSFSYKNDFTGEDLHAKIDVLVAKIAQCDEKIALYGKAYMAINGAYVAASVVEGVRRKQKEKRL